MRAMKQNMGIIGALMTRDLIARFGRDHLGFVWTVLEPLILTTGVMLIWSLLKEPTIHGVPVLSFVMTGYMPLTLWRHLTSPMVKIVRKHASLLYHQPISIAHILLARILLEVLSLSGALSVTYFVTVSCNLIEPVNNWGLALLAWLLGAWYYGALGIVIAGLTEMWEPAERFVQPIQYLALPVSGVFFMVDWLPGYARTLLVLNPSVNYFEMFRGGFLGPGVTTHYSATYLAVCSLAATLLGMATMRGARLKLDYA